MKIETHNFKGMTDVKGTLKGPFFQSVSAANKFLRSFRIVSASGDNGAINIYKTDSGMWACEFMQYQNSVEYQAFKTKTKTEAMSWLKSWIGKLK